MNNILLVYLVGCMIIAGLAYQDSKENKHNNRLQDCIIVIILSWFALGYCIGIIAEDVEKIKERQHDK